MGNRAHSSSDADGWNKILTIKKIIERKWTNQSLTAIWTIVNIVEYSREKIIYIFAPRKSRVGLLS